MNKYLKFLLLLIGVSGVGYVFHNWALDKLQVQDYWAQTGYTLLQLYTFFAVASLAITVLLCVSRYAFPNYVAFIFLGGFVLKALGGYLYIRSGFDILASDFVEYNFLVVFFLFLFFDAYVAYVLVNQGEKQPEQ